MTEEFGGFGQVSVGAAGFPLSGKAGESDCAAEHFLAAQLALIGGRGSEADRRLQQALAIQSRSPEVSPDHSPASSWFVLAAAALLKKDFDSCEAWLKAADRVLYKLSGSGDSPLLRHAAGDLLTLRSCLLAQTNHYEAAGRMLIQAFRNHMEAGSGISAVIDLILRSRLLVLCRQWNDAEDILDLAASALRQCSESLREDIDRISRIMNRDLRLVRDNLEARRAARCN